MQRATLAIVLVFAAVVASAQAPQPAQRKAEPPGAISGAVVDGSTGEPISNASVTIAGGGAKGMLQTRLLTDAKGRFVFINMPPGQDYTLSAIATGYFAGAFNRDHAPTDQKATIPLKSDEWVRDVQVKVWKPGSIAGRVFDEAGEPLVGVYVRVLSRLFIAGREQLVAGSVVTTDDRGAYRIGNLTAGRYVVEVPSVQVTAPAPAALAAPSPGLGTVGRYPGPLNHSADGRPRGYPITFHPAARSISEATSVEISLSEERSGIDVSLAPASLVKISGLIQGPSTGLTLRLVPVGLEALGNGGEAGTTPINPDGSFAFAGVPSGAYLIDVRRRIAEFFGTGQMPQRKLPGPSGSSTTYFLSVQAVPPNISLFESAFGNNAGAANAHARQPINVGTDDISGIVITLKEAGTMDGVAELDVLPDKLDARPTGAKFVLDPAAGLGELGLPDTQAQEGSFHIDSIRSGEYWFRLTGGNDWVIKSVRWNGEDYTRRPFDATTKSSFAGVAVTITNRVATITGSVKEKNAAVILFPSDPSLWTDFGFNPTMIKSVFAGTDGTYRFETLPAGDYFVVAVDPANRMAWLEPGFFSKMMPFASRVSVDWGGSRSANLLVVAVRR